LAWGVNVVVGLYALGTVLFAVMTPSTLTGDVGPLVGATLSAPYTITPHSGPRVSVTRYGQVPYSPGVVVRGVTTHVRVRVAKDDKDSRVLVTANLVVDLVLGWIGLLALRGVVFSAADGDPFDEHNAARLRRLAATLVAVPVLTLVLNRLLSSRLDVPGVHHPTVASVSIVPLLVSALVVAALAEVFRRGAQLRALEAATI
jgi:hypothetical protein